MKRFPIIILVLLIGLLASGCGQAKNNTVPDKLLEWEVEDFVQQHEERNGKYTDYNYSIAHTPDRETNTDTIDMELIVTYPYVTTLSRFHGVYQQNKKDNNWSFLRGSKWETPSIVQYSFPTSIMEWQQPIIKLGAEWTSVTKYEELQKKEYYFLYEGWPELVDEIVDSWRISVAWDLSNGQYSFIMREDYGEEAIAQRAFQAYYSLYKEQYAIEALTCNKEANCSWYKFALLDDNGKDAQMLILQADQDVFVFESENTSTLENLLANVGFSITR